MAPVPGLLRRVTIAAALSLLVTGAVMIVALGAAAGTSQCPDRRQLSVTPL
jgi:hypothetical protein